MAGDAEPFGQRDGNEVSIYRPLAFWILMMVIGLAVSIALPIVTSVLPKNAIPSGGATAASAGGYLLGVPGIYIFPLIVGIWLGERVGRAARNSEEAIKLGLLNAVYASIVYTIAAFIIYLTINYADAQLIGSLALFGGTTPFALDVVGLPVLAVLVLTPLFAIISSARRVHV